jgi:hypothetical protein
MSQELKNCEVEITQAIRNIKLDPKTFKMDIQRSLDSAGQFFSDHLKSVRRLFEQGNYDESIAELEKLRFRLDYE